MPTEVMRSRAFPGHFLYESRGGFTYRNRELSPSRVKLRVLVHPQLCSPTSDSNENLHPGVENTALSNETHASSPISRTMELLISGNGALNGGFFGSSPRN